MGHFLQAAVAILSLVVATHALGELYADLRLAQSVGVPIALFRCTTGNDQLFYLRHMLTWSKIGRDGREKYLSINWNILPEARAEGYEVASQVYYENTTLSPNGTYKLYFVLSRGALTADDQGEYICRLHDIDRNFIAEESIQTVIFENALTMIPLEVETEVGTGVAVNCMYNATDRAITDQVTISHLDKAGVVTKISTGGKLISPEMASKYHVMVTTDPDGTVNNILTLLASTKEDTGFFMCELFSNNVTIATSKAKITVGRPKLNVSPMFFLQMPEDSNASFECSCDVNNTDACVTHNLSWSLREKKSGKRTLIYKKGKLMDDPNVYSISKRKNGTSLVLNINSLAINKTEGDYICSLSDANTTEELATKYIPTSVNPIAINAVIMMDQYPDKIRLLCLVVGTHWNTHYLETHTLSWQHSGHGGNHVLTENGNLTEGVDSTKYSLLFDTVRGYSVLDVSGVTAEDYGEYDCILSNQTNVTLQQTKLSMYGKGNSTVVG